MQLKLFGLMSFPNNTIVVLGNFHDRKEKPINGQTPAQIPHPLLQITNCNVKCVTCGYVGVTLLSVCVTKT